jgi:hypothetical protein
MRPLILALSVFAALSAQERPLPDFQTFSAQVRKHLATDEERQSGHMFIERRVEQKVDASGRVTGESVKVFEVYPGLPGGLLPPAGRETAVRLRRQAREAGP